MESGDWTQVLLPTELFQFSSSTTSFTEFYIEINMLGCSIFYSLYLRGHSLCFCFEKAHCWYYTLGSSIPFLVLEHESLRAKTLLPDLLFLVAQGPGNIKKCWPGMRVKKSNLSHLLSFDNRVDWTWMVDFKGCLEIPSRWEPWCDQLYCKGLMARLFEIGNCACKPHGRT